MQVSGVTCPMLRPRARSTRAGPGREGHRPRTSADGSTARVDFPMGLLHAPRAVWPPRHRAQCDTRDQVHPVAWAGGPQSCSAAEAILTDSTACHRPGPVRSQAVWQWYVIVGHTAHACSWIGTRLHTARAHTQTRHTCARCICVHTYMHAHNAHRDMYECKCKTHVSTHITRELTCIYKCVHIYTQVHPCMGARTCLHGTHLHAEVHTQTHMHTRAHV